MGKRGREQHEQQQVMRNIGNRFGEHGRRAHQKILKQTNGGRILGKRRPRAGDVAERVTIVHVFDHETPVRQRVPLGHSASNRKENTYDEPAAEHGKTGRQHQTAKRHVPAKPTHQGSDQRSRRENVDTDHSGIQRTGKSKAIQDRNDAKNDRRECLLDSHMKNACKKQSDCKHRYYSKHNRHNMPHKSYLLELYGMIYTIVI